MKGFATVFRKEVIENLRDRRAAFNSLLLGPILFPFLIIGMSYLGIATQEERAEQTIELPVVGAEHAPNLLGFLQQQGVVILDAPEDPEGVVRAQTHPLVLRIPAAFPDQWRAGEPALVEVIADPTRRESDIPMGRVKRMLAAYGQQIGAARLQLRGVAPSIAAPLVIKDIDLSTPQSRGALVLAFLPYFLMITAFTGGMHIAIDSTAGEKERRSLEPLLLNPTPRSQIMIGKIAAGAAFALASLMLTMLSFRLALPYMPTGALGFELELGPVLIGKLLLVVGPVALLAAGLLTLLATFAKGFREAQSYMGLVIFIPMIPSLIYMVNPVKPEAWMMTIPMFSQNLLIGEFLRGASFPTSWLLLSSGGTLLLGLLLAAVAATLFNRPKIIFGGG